MDKNKITKPIILDETAKRQAVALETLAEKVGFLKGDKGDKGDTPIKGQDYYTEVDKAEIKDDVKTAVLGEIHIPTDNNELTNGAGYITSSSLPTKVSELTNDTGFITNSDIPTNISAFTNDSNYQTLTDVQGIIAGIARFTISVVDTLPDTGAPMVLYLVPRAQNLQTETNIYDEYLWIEQTSSFEHLGSTAVDLSDYYTKTEADVLLADKQPKMAIVTTQNTYNDVKTFLEEGRTVYFNYSGNLLICGSLSTATIFTFQTAYHGTNMYWALCGLRANGTTSWQSGSTTVALKSDLPTTTSQLTNDSGFVTQDALLEKTTETWTFTLEDGTTTTKTMVLGA